LALADYTRVIDALPGAPVEQVAKALVNRGVVHGQQGSPDKAMADYTRVIDALPGAPVEDAAHAMGNRGWLHYEAGRIDEFLSDSENALARAPNLGWVAFNLCLGLLAKGRDAEALDRYRKAVLEFPKEEFPKDIAAARKDVEEAVGKWLTPERAKPVLEILKGDAP
jgi:tetratricopeptide (TPR) repeat protein